MPIGAASSLPDDPAAVADEAQGHIYSSGALRNGDGPPAMDPATSGGCEARIRTKKADQQGGGRRVSAEG